MFSEQYLKFISTSGIYPLEVHKTIALVGLMGAGKSSVGWRLAKCLNLPFFDSDREIEKAAGCSLSDIYERWGKKAFKEAEKKVIHRLLEGPIHVLSTGDGSFISNELRKTLKEKTLTIWLKADLTTLHERVSRRQTRPQLLEGDSLEILENLAKERDAFYSEASLMVESHGKTHEETVGCILEKLQAYSN